MPENPINIVPQNKPQQPKPIKLIPSFGMFNQNLLQLATLRQLMLN